MLSHAYPHTYAQNIWRCDRRPQRRGRTRQAGGVQAYHASTAAARLDGGSVCPAARPSVAITAAHFTRLPIGKTPRKTCRKPPKTPRRERFWDGLGRRLKGATPSHIWPSRARPRARESVRRSTASGQAARSAGPAPDSRPSLICLGRPGARTALIVTSIQLGSPERLRSLRS
jgi:hypothetical protein